MRRARDFAAVRGLDFNDPGAAKTINSWVEQNTQGKIKEIVDDPIGRELVMFLINAIYFKGMWTYQFDPQQTRDEPFNLPDVSRRRLHHAGGPAFCFCDSREPFRNQPFCWKNHCAELSVNKTILTYLTA